MRVEFYRHDLNPEASQAVADVLRGPILTSGDVGRAVEQQLCDYFSVRHAGLTNSWTNGALALLLALGVEPGDEIIVPAMSFIASANVGELLGARIVFADVDPATLLLTPETLAAAVSPKTRVVMAVHLYGQMCDMEGLRAALPDDNSVVLIEDAAHCFEGTRAGYRPGARSDAAILSFYATKNVTCGEGGAVLTNDTALFERFAMTRQHGMSASAADRFAGGAYNPWDMMLLGCKANLPDILAALLVEQIASVNQRHARRRVLAARYREALAFGPWRLPACEAACMSAEHLFPVGVPPEVRDRCMHALTHAGIGCTVNYNAIHTTRYYAQEYALPPDTCPEATTWGRGTFSLPLYPGLSEAAQDHVIRIMRETVATICTGAVS